MKISYSALNHKLFIQALQSLSGQRMPTKVAYDIGKLMQKVEQAVKAARPEYQKIMDEVAEKDSNGLFVPNADGSGPKLKEEKLELYEKLMQEFMSKEIELDARPIYIGHLEHTSLAPAEVEALSPVLTELHVQPT